MSTVIRLANFRKDRASRSLGAAASPCRLDPATFTLRDRYDLEGWVAPDRDVAFHSCEIGDFAMLYRHGAAWASWGVVRQDRHVLVWDCVTLADIGRFQSMTDALAALPVRHGAASPSVLPFATSPQRYAAYR